MLAATFKIESIDLVGNRIPDMVLRLLVAAVCGFIIGFERMIRSKEAGIRTHTIVCFAAALMMVVSKYCFADLSAADGSRGADPSRVAAQIVSGIGFLGAGIIFYRKNMLHGLTTAAGIWATAAIGMALGSGMYIIGTVSTVMLVLLQIILHRPFRHLRAHYSTTGGSIMKMTVSLVDSETLKTIQEIFGTKHFLKFKTNNAGGVNADIELVSVKDFSPEEIYEITVKYPFILSLERSDDL